jgi:hypothetical protein
VGQESLRQDRPCGGAFFDEKIAVGAKIATTSVPGVQLDGFDTIRTLHPQSVRCRHGGRFASRHRTTSIGAFVVDGEPALQLTQRRAFTDRARSFIASAPRN